MTYELLEEFLMECAKFYKSMYLKALENKLQACLENIKIIILIPDLKYIKQLIETSMPKNPTTEKLDRQEKANNTADVLANVIFERLNKNNFYHLINTDKGSMSEILKCLQNRQLDFTKNTEVVELPIHSVTSFGCKKIQTFFPYTLRRIKKYSDFRGTPLVNQDLADFINEIHTKIPNRESNA